MKTSIGKKSEHPVIGQYALKRSNRSKSIRIVAHPIKGLTITIPWFITKTQLEKFLFQKKEWVTKAIERQRTKEQLYSRNLSHGTTIELINGSITIEHKECNSVSKEERDGHYTITIPIYTNLKCETEEQRVVQEVTSAIGDSARRYLPIRARELAKQHHITFGKLFLKNNKSNWGSCSSLGNINLNIHLMRLTPQLCDYVILHEIAHIIHRNHGAQFHQLVNEMTHGKERELSAQLKKYRTQYW